MTTERTASTREQVRAYLESHPYSSSRQTASALGVSVSTVRRYLRELGQEGVLRCQPRYVSQFGYTREYYLQDPHSL